MSEETSDTAQLLKTSVGRIISNIGIVLAHTQESLLKDFLAEMPSYVPAAEGYGYAEFKADLEGKALLEKFIESLFRRLGYELSAFEKNKTLTDNIRAILATTLSLGESIQQLFDGETDWMGEAKKFIEAAGGEGPQAKELFGELLEGGGKNAVSASLSLGNDKISAVFQLILELVSLIRKFRDMEWEKIARENEAFGRFLQETYFSKKFAERVFNHVFVVLLRHAKEVFADDIHAIVEHLDEVKSSLSKEAKDKIKALRDEIREIEAEIAAEAKKLAEEAKAAGEALVEEVSAELRVRLKLAKAKLDKLLGEVLGDYNRIGKTFHHIYAVLEFLKVVDKETIQLAKYIPNAPAFPEVNIAEVNNLIVQANGAAKDVAESAIQTLKSLCPTVELYVICWPNLEQLLSEPIPYFKALFPLKDFDDAEALLEKIQKLASAFHFELPHFGSLKALLYEFFIRIRERIRDEINPLASEVKAKFAQFENFIIDLLKVLEKFAIGLKRELGAAYENFESKKDSLIGELKSGLGEAVGQLKDAGGKLKNFTLPNTNIQFRRLSGLDTSFLKNLFADEFIAVLSQKAKEHELLSGISADAWKAAIEESISKNIGQSFIGQYKSILEEAEKHVTALFESGTWEAKFEGAIAELQNEFKRQTAKVPDDFEGIKNFCKGSLDELISGKKLSNPFSAFDFSAYFKAFADKLKGMLPNNAEFYFVKFQEATVDALCMLVENTSTAPLAALKGKLDNEKLGAFAREVFVAYWPKLKASFYKMLIRPFVALIEQTVKKWVKEKLIPRVLEYVESNIASELNFGAYQQIFSEVENFSKEAEKACNEASQALQAKAWAENAVAMARNLLMLSAETKDIDAWSDGLQFALKLYKLIPSTLKNHLRELIDFPNWNFEGIGLPEYKLDIENKFLALTLYESGSLKGGQFSADVSIKLLAFVGDRKVGTGEDGEALIESGLYVLPAIRGNFDAGFNLGESHWLSLSANAALNDDATQKSESDKKTKDALAEDALGFFFCTPNGKHFPEAKWLSSKEAASAYVELLFRRGQVGSAGAFPLTIFETDVAGLTLEDYPQKLFAGYAGGGFDFGYLGGLRGLLFKLRLHKLNDFFAVILKNDIEVSLEKLDLGYSLKKGFQFDGEYRLRIPIQSELHLSALKLSNMSFELGGGNLKNIEAKLLTNLSVDFKGIALSFPELGFGVDVNYMKPTGGFGDLDFSPEFQFSTGVGVSINLEAVKGTGIINWNKEKGEFLGAAELNILDLCGASALLLFNMKMPDGSKGFSFMGALSVFFKMGIQLGMGFSLTAIGGSLGINRRIDTEKLRNAVRDGSLNSILFAKDLDKNLERVLSNISSYYPVQENQLFFGFLAQITWAEILKVDVGLFIQAPEPVTLMLAGGVHLSISESTESLLAIHVHFMGEIDFSKGLSFDASLVDSHIVGISLYGDMALRIYWAGNTKGFILSAGGFHPQYKPEAGFRLGQMKRLGLKLNYGILKLSLETYFALTSNTVQFGAAVQLKIGWEKFGLSGNLSFNALFQFNPFMFMVDVSAGVCVKCAGWTLFAVNLSFALSGPAPWNAKGSASFWFLFIKIKVAFNQTWGKKQKSSTQKYIEIKPLYSKNFHENGNWKLVSGDVADSLIGMAPMNTQELVMQPSDRLSFSQNAIPLNQEMARYGEALPGDAKKIKLKSITIENEAVEFEETKASFSPTLIRMLKDDEKLKAPSYEDMNAGFVLKASFDEKHGDTEEVTSECERICQDVNWEKWAQYAADNAASRTKGTRAQRAEASRLSAQTPARFGDLRCLARKMVEAPSAVKVSRASRRRTNTGFKRYRRELDNNLNSSVAHLLEK
ncbi:MAG: hypothetical protein FWG75_06345 [Cystobacterineae bacterium]|nr:hypothetical protein [Cystobacterineae bacterium]